MNTRTKHLIAMSVLLLAGTADVCAQSAIYACGHIRRNRTSAIGKLRSSGYTTAILFNVNVENDGTLTTDYDWSKQQAAEAGGIICQNGKYVFDKYQPNYVDDVKKLLKQPTSINRIEICIGGWLNGSYGKIRNLINSFGTGEETMLYKNFKALHDMLPEIVAVNNDQEQDYDVDAAVKFHTMLAKIGFKTTIAPYMNKSFWQSLVSRLPKGTCDIVYLQTYGGGAGNNPADWKVFGDIPMYIGFDCEASGDLGDMQRKFQNWHDNNGVKGGFLWNYNSEARDVNEWATAINRIFKVKTTNSPKATFYQDINYGGYAISLPEGSFNQSEMALYGIKAKDITSMKISSGYQVTLYSGPSLSVANKTWTGDVDWIGDQWNDRACSIKIEPIPVNGISTDAVVGDGVLSAVLSPAGDKIMVTGAGVDSAVELYNVAAGKVASAVASSDGSATIDISGLSKGVYVVKNNRHTVKLLKH
ncbi:MAG: T9SS type A sorting domain-containing protein [Prevotella sp.]